MGGPPPLGGGLGPAYVAPAGAIPLGGVVGVVGGGRLFRAKSK